MQRVRLKFVAGLSILFFFSLLCSAQTSSFRLKTADSLFLAKRYTQSFDHYKEILSQKQYSPAMLLRMAYIEEGLNNIGGAMYYLNLYFLATNDTEVLGKMDELAKKNNLEGYEASEADAFISFYHDHRQNISLALVALAVFMLSLTFYTRFRLKRRPIASAIVLTLILTGLFVHLNLGERMTTAIVTNPATYVMNGPSAGASVVEILKDGHRVEVIGKRDVWMKIRWDGNIAYVRENCVLPIQL